MKKMYRIISLIISAAILLGMQTFAINDSSTELDLDNWKLKNMNELQSVVDDYFD
jgi:hypothetical protein